MHVAILAALLVSAIAAPPQPGSVGEARYRVTGRSLAEVYVDGGRLQGLGPGDRLRVLGTGDAAVAELEVVRVQERTSTCRVLSVSRPIGTGDVVVRIAPAARSGLAAMVPTMGGATTSAPKPAPASATVTLPAKPPAGPTKAASPGLAALAVEPRPTPTPTPAPAPTPTPTPTPTPPALSAKVAALPALTPSPTPTKAAPTPAPASPSASTSTAQKDSPPSASASPPAAQAPASSVPAAAPTAAPTAGQAPFTTTAGVATAAKLAPGDGKTFTVRYRSAGTVYLEGGRAQGLDVGDRLQVTAGKTVVAEIEVQYVAEQSASCRVRTETRPVRVGDSAMRVARAATSAPAEIPKTPPPVPAASAPALASPAPIPSGTGAAVARPFARVQGSASVGYFESTDHTGSGMGWSERTARVDLIASDIDGQPLSLTVRGRSRQDNRERTLSDRTPMSERADRLYEVALRYDPPSDAFSLEAGRIGIYRFVGIGYLDGALVRFRPATNLHLGAFGGRAVEIEGLGFNGTGAKYGAFVQFAPGGRYSMRGLDTLLAVVRETAQGDVSREYLSLETRYSGGGRYSLFERAEVDLNRGWRQEATGKTLQLSNISLTGNLQVASSAWAFVSYDGRRSYRYYRNRLVPEEVFDDLLHQGLRAGLNLSRPGGFGATAGFGMTLKEQDPRNPELNIANAYSLNGSVRHANLFGLSVGLDGSGFSNGYADGALVSARVGKRFGAGHTLDFSYGRSVYRVKSTEEDRKTQWLRMLGRLELGRHAYLSGDLEYDKGDDLDGPRGLLEAGWIF